LELLAMLLASLQRDETNNEKRNDSRKPDSNDYADSPFECAASFHSMRTDEHKWSIDYKPLNALGCTAFMSDAVRINQARPID
jgi:hypothetical protein